MSLAAQTWSDSALADACSAGMGDLWGTSPGAQAVRFPPALFADSNGTLWLLDSRGTLIRGRGAAWQRVQPPVRQLMALAPQDDGGAVMLGAHDEGFELVGMARQGHARWRHGSRELADAHGGTPLTHPRLLQDERGVPYLHARGPADRVWHIDAAHGTLRLLAAIEGHAGPLLAWDGALWRIGFDGTQRRWLRRRFDGNHDEPVMAGGALDDTFLMAVAVAPHGGPVLTDGRRLLVLHPGGQQQLVLPRLPPPTPPLPAVWDLLRARPRPGALWVVHADGAGWAVHALPLG